MESIRFQSALNRALRLGAAIFVVHAQEIEPRPRNRIGI
jgi:hypothetical protein